MLDPKDPRVRCRDTRLDAKTKKILREFFNQPGVPKGYQPPEPNSTQSTKKSSSKLFSRDDMICFGRYVDDGRGSNIKSMFRAWYDGPEEAKRPHTTWKE
jgi:hypothetical protein